MSIRVGTEVGGRGILVIQVRNEGGLNQGSGIRNKEKWICF